VPSLGSVTLAVGVSAHLNGFRTVGQMTPLAEQCSRPKQLWLGSFDPSTGRKGPQREVLIACGNRRASQCEACSLVYQRDAMTLIQSGLYGEDGKPEPLTFLTLTAPGYEVFGKVHSRRTKWNKKKRAYIHYGCECGRWHNENDSILGQPLDPDTYNYEAAARWNAASSRLLAVTLQKLSRLHFGPPAKGEKQKKLDYIRVAEYQRRGLTHFHILVRAAIDVKDFHAVVRGGTTSAGREVARVQHHGNYWGRQCDLRAVRKDSQFGVGAYLVKLVRYAIKSTRDENDNGGLMGARMRRAGAATCECGETWKKAGHICDAAQPVPFSPEHRIVCRRHRLAEGGYGYRAHTLAKSRTWGTTFREIRGARVKFHGPRKLLTVKEFVKARTEARKKGKKLRTPSRFLVWSRIPDPPNA